MAPAALEGWLVTRIAALTGQPPDDIDPDRPMEAYGLTSVMAVGLSAELEDMLGIPVDATIAWDHPTIEGLATHLAAAAAAARS
jgi:acyl carrier protein